MNIYQMYSPSLICETSQGILDWISKESLKQQKKQIDNIKIQMKPVDKVLSSRQDCLIDLKVPLWLPEGINILFPGKC